MTCATAVRRRSFHTAPAPFTGADHVEILLQLWDEMDDWLAACRQALKRNLT